MTGLRYDAAERTLYIDSKIGDFTSFISTNSGFGTVQLTGEEVSVKMEEGNLSINKVLISGEEGKLI